MKKAAVIAVLLAVAGFANAQERASVRSVTLPVVETELKEGAGKAGVMSNCGSCHSLDYIVMQPEMSRGEWAASVGKMRNTFGAQVSDEDAGAIAAYLAGSYGTEKGTVVAAATASAAEPAKKPAGEELFKKHCAACHKDGGNIIKKDKTLFKKELEKRGIKKADDIVKVIRKPGPGMPKMDEKALPDPEAKAIAEYILKTFK